jgi:type IV secretion system protein VirD4
LRLRARERQGGPVRPRPEIAEPPSEDEAADDENPRAAERRRQPELDRMKPVEKKEPLDNEFSPDAAN